MLEQDEQNTGTAIDETPASHDETLMQQMQRGQPNALGILFGRYQRLVFTVALRILRNSTEAEDLTQDVFIEIYRKAHLYDPRKGSVKTWVLQYAYHRSFNRRKRLSLTFSDNASEGMRCSSVRHHDGSLDRILRHRECQETLLRGMKSLNHRERAIIECVSFEGLTLREASARLQVSYVNARNHYYRGLKKLKKIADQRSGESPRPINRTRSCAA